MFTYIGKTGVDETFQEDFKETIPCVHCGEEARIAFVAAEDYPNNDEYVCNLYQNHFGDGGDFWPHDAVAVAIYFCTKCAEATAIYNQA